MIVLTVVMPRTSNAWPHERWVGRAGLPNLYLWHGAFAVQFLGDLRVVLVNGRVEPQPFSLIPSILDFTEHLGDVIPFGRLCGKSKNSYSSRSFV